MSRAEIDEQFFGEWKLRQLDDHSLDRWLFNWNVCFFLIFTFLNGKSSWNVQVNFTKKKESRQIEDPFVLLVVVVVANVGNILDFYVWTMNILESRNNVNA